MYCSGVNWWSGGRVVRGVSCGSGCVKCRGEGFTVEVEMIAVL